MRALYRQLLEREPTPGERAAQSAWLKSGANNVSQLAARLVLGEEYEKRFVRGKTFDDVLLGLYRHALARIPDEKGLKSNQAQFRNATFPTIALAFLDNGEYERRFGEWNVPGEPMTMRYCSERK